MLTIDLASTIPLVEQVAQGIRSAIARGEVRPGDELPSVRQLAADLGINLNTVARAYRSLEADGLVRSARGRGTRVTADVEERTAKAAQRTTGALRRAITDAKLAGLGRRAVEREIRRQLDQLWPAKAR